MTKFKFKPYLNQVSTVLLWGSVRGKFEKPSEKLYSGKDICVAGTITEFSGWTGDHCDRTTTNKKQVNLTL